MLDLHSEHTQIFKLLFIIAAQNSLFKSSHKIFIRSSLDLLETHPDVEVIPKDLLSGSFHTGRDSNTKVCSVRSFKELQNKASQIEAEIMVC